MRPEDIRKQKSETVTLANEEAVKEVVTEAVLKLWDVVSDLTRLRPSKFERYRVTIFGSARAQPGSRAYEETKRVAAALAEMGCDIITGGGPGLMQAANEGAASVGQSERSRSVGIRIHLPFEQGVNPFVAEMYEHKSFFSRLHHFVLASDAFVVAPGGVGTLLELTLVWQLLQVRHMHGTPLILVGKMWPGLIEWARTHLLNSEQQLANPEDLDIPKCVESGDAAISLIREHVARWKAAEAESSPVAR